jgi:3-methylcrotonyl-CoA carboxylase beta subunit
VKAATGEVVTAELGGADVHTRISGVADHMAEDDGHAPRSRATSWRIRARAARRRRRSPLSPALRSRRDLRPHPERHAQTFDARETCGSDARATSSRRATTLITGFAHLNGIPVGIPANQGVLFSESAPKATHFIASRPSVWRPAALPAEHQRLHRRQAA